MPRHFLDGLDADLKKSLLGQLRILWAHTSTALEGNSLTLGETHQVLTEGLTISGKPLKDHNEVVGHAKAEDLMEALIATGADATKEDLFDLHRAVQTNVSTDVYQPVGDWKKEPNSAIVVLDEKQVTNDTYAHPDDVPALMDEWLGRLNSFRKGGQSEDDALGSYTWLHASFVRIHPFADGNGRMARLLANMPVLISGLPPILIPAQERMEYIRSLARWQLSLGRPHPGKPLVTENAAYQELKPFYARAWQPSQKLVADIRALQKKRTA